MASIGEVYGAHSRGMVEPGQRRAGFAMFLGGIAMGAVGLVVATTGIGDALGLGTYDARLFAGIFGGIGTPLALLGILLLFPVNRRAWGAAAIGSGIALLGVTLFWYAYPVDWAGYGRDFTGIVSAVYLFGLVTISWALFTTVATFKRRNDPGGTVNLQVTPETGVPRLFRVAREGLRTSTLAGGSWFGSDGGSTQQITHSTDGGSEPSAPMSVGVTDGGDGEIVSDQPSTPDPVDRYCGNCTHFTYGHDEHGKLSPYCQYDDEAMDDMEPCDAWQSNTS